MSILWTDLRFANPWIGWLRLMKRLIWISARRVRKGPNARMTQSSTQQHLSWRSSTNCKHHFFTNWILKNQMHFWIATLLHRPYDGILGYLAYCTKEFSEKRIPFFKNYCHFMLTDSDLWDRMNIPSNYIVTVLKYMDNICYIVVPFLGWFRYITGCLNQWLIVRQFQLFRISSRRWQEKNAKMVIKPGNLFSLRELKWRLAATSSL